MNEIVPLVPEGGNTKTPSLSKDKAKQDSVKYNYCMTLNNWTPEEYSSTISFFEEYGTKWIVGKEVGEEGTPHLQMYVCFKVKKRFTWIKKHMPRARIEQCKGNSMANLKYCSKDGDYVGRIDGKVYRRPRSLVKMVYQDLRPPQKLIADKFVAYENALFGRKIYWFWEETGGWGKTVLTKYFLDSHELTAMTIASKTADAFHQIAKYVEENGCGPDIIICDIPRSSIDFINYGAMEKIKDGCFSSGKYEGMECRINSPHIICFANAMPKLEKMSLCRWRIINCEDIAEKIDGGGVVPVEADWSLSGSDD